ncbi:MAG TPA: division/cell wall cluster transcriptional repressor MraZ [Candidatus Nanoarchaeia archaeon]|nr:division/cell wall cluster transcriptional repressor MraZ [Candidatus Nanoarchaeia archaeon]
MISPIHYLSTYERRLDKGRFVLPEPFRDPEIVGFFMFPILSDSSRYILMYDSHTMEERLTVARETQDTNAPVVPISEGTPIGRADYVTMQNGNRISVPLEMRTAVGIDVDILVVGAFDRIELWNPSDWKQLSDEELVLMKDRLHLD